MSELSVLHLLANYKWTGPADPAIRTAAHLQRQGAAVTFAEAQWRDRGRWHRLQSELGRWRLPVLRDLELRKHFHPISHWRDVVALSEHLRRGDVDVMHCHLLADHLIAALAKRRAGVPVRLVRTLYDPLPPPEGWRGRLAFAATEGVVVPSAACADAVITRYRLAAERVLVVEPPVEPRDEGADLRAELGLSRDDLVVGITARVQPHRRFDLLWHAAHDVVKVEPRARFVLLGRGDEADVRRLVRDPVERLGLVDHVLLPGYLGEPDYGRALRSLDVFLFLVPGSDGTCRAVREAMACGLPIVATRRGILPALIEGNGSAAGVLCDETPASLSSALLGLLHDAERRARLGAAARQRARTEMDPDRAAVRLLHFYRELRPRTR